MLVEFAGKNQSESDRDQSRYQHDAYEVSVQSAYKDGHGSTITFDIEIEIQQTNTGLLYQTFLTRIVYIFSEGLFLIYRGTAREVSPRSLCFSNFSKSSYSNFSL